MAFDLDKIVRENVRRLVPYSSAREEFKGAAEVWLDANENSFGSTAAPGYNRYPDPLQTAIRHRLAESTHVSPEQIFVGNGSDEAIDLLFRIFCRPGLDNALVCPPTYGMYEVAAQVNDVLVREVPLTAKFDLDRDAITAAIDENTRLIFVCSPNNPTGNLMKREAILDIAEAFDGIVVVDEAYIHFSRSESLISEITHFPNLVILQTFSKAWGLAGLRVGLAFATSDVISLFNKIKPPYNVSQVAQEMTLTALENGGKAEDRIAAIVSERERLAGTLARFSFVEEVHPSDANFLLVRMVEPSAVYEFLLSQGIVVRDRSSVQLCTGCLRITVGTPSENDALINALKQYEKSLVH